MLQAIKLIPRVDVMHNFDTTPTIKFKQLVPTDLEDFWQWASDEEVTKNLLWETYTSKEAAENFLTNIAAQHPWFKAIVINEKTIGSISLERGKGNKVYTAELGYVIAKQYWGQGYGSYAVKQTLKDAFKQLDIERIEALVDPENLPSQKGLEKCNFQQEACLESYILHKGRLRDRLIYSMTRKRFLEK